MNTYKSMLAFILLGIGGLSVAQAANTANSYTCKGKKVNLTLNVGTNQPGIFPTETTMNLRLDNKTYQFRKAEISAEKVTFGTLWEVSLNHVPDVYIDFATVVIPTVQLESKLLSFKSQLILTRLLTPFTGEPQEGVVNASKYIDLSCSATLLYY